MSQSTLFVGESGGGRILACGGGVISQVGTDYELAVETWPTSPAGPAGDVLFRIVSVVLDCVGGYHVTVTPIVDGVEEPAQTFSGGTTGRVEVQAYVAKRGASIAARVETVERFGPVALLDITWSGFVLRSTP